jgi:TPR repeat protein
MRRFLVALAIVGVGFSPTVSAQTKPAVGQNYSTADALTLVAAAKAGVTEAMIWLGVRHSNLRQDVPLDHRQATAWFLKAAEAGDPSGMYWVGVAFWSGRGVAQDFVEGYKWLDLSAKYGDRTLREQATNTLAGLTRIMTPQMISEAKARETEWVKSFEKKRKA